MPVQSKQVWETSDGLRFDTRAEAEAHEALSARDGDIELFLTQSERSSRAKARIARELREWLAWEASRPGPNPPGQQP